MLLEYCLCCTLNASGSFVLDYESRTKLISLIIILWGHIHKAPEKLLLREISLFLVF